MPKHVDIQLFVWFFPLRLFGSLGGDIMGPYPRLRDPKALKPSAFRMISWAKSRFFCVISYRGQDDVHRFYYVRMYSWSTCFKCVWWHVRPRGGPHESRMDIDVLLTYAIPLVKKNLKNNTGKVWRLCFIALLLHPHSRENGASEMMETWRYPWVGDEVGWAKR